MERRLDFNKKDKQLAIIQKVRAWVETLARF
jgi:hypothetical protein